VLVQAVAPTGTAVLDAAHPLADSLAGCCAGSVLFFGSDPTLPALVAHRQRGGRWVSLRAGAVVLGEGSREVGLVPLALPVEGALPAVAAAWSLGRRPEEMAAALGSFTGELQPERRGSVPVTLPVGG
jgi:cyanophycin synthetase